MGDRTGRSGGERKEKREGEVVEGGTRCSMVKLCMVKLCNVNEIP